MSKLFMVQVNDNQGSKMEICTETELLKVKNSKQKVENVYLFAVFDNEFTSLEEVILSLDKVLAENRSNPTLEFSHDQSLVHQNYTAKGQVVYSPTKTPVKPLPP